MVFLAHQNHMASLKYFFHFLFQKIFIEQLIQMIVCVLKKISEMRLAEE